MTGFVLERVMMNQELKSSKSKKCDREGIRPGGVGDNIVLGH